MLMLFQHAARVQPLDEGVARRVPNDPHTSLSLDGDFGIFDDAPDLRYWVEVPSEEPCHKLTDAPLKLRV